MCGGIVVKVLSKGGEGKGEGEEKPFFSALFFFFKSLTLDSLASFGSCFVDTFFCC